MQTFKCIQLSPSVRVKSLCLEKQYTSSQLKPLLQRTTINLKTTLTCWLKTSFIVFDVT